MLDRADVEAFIDLARERLDGEWLIIGGAVAALWFDADRLTEDIDILHRGPRATIYRPTPTLFLLLKIRRMSEKDLSDCLRLLDHAQQHGLPIDRERVAQAVRELPHTDDAALAARRRRLLEALGAV